MNGTDPRILDDPTDPLMELLGNDGPGIAPDDIFALHRGFHEPYNCAAAGIGSCTDAPQNEPSALDLRAVGYGPGWAFAREWLDRFPGDPVTVVPCGRGGSAIAMWIPDATDHFNRHTFYGSCAFRGRYAEQVLPGILSGVIYNQGETEAFDHNEAAWTDGFFHIVAAIREDFGVDVGVVFARLTKNFIWGTADAHALRMQQESIDLPGVAMVSSDTAHEPPEHFEERGETIRLVDERLHLSSASQRLMGKRYARAMVSVIDGPPH